MNEITDIRDQESAKKQGEPGCETGEEAVETAPQKLGDQSLPVELAQIPTSLISFRRWVVWRAVDNNGKIGKVPYRATSPLNLASVKSPTHWGTFDEAQQAYSADPGVSGIGIVLTGVENLIGIDLDSCVDRDGSIAAWAHEIMQLLPSYWEYSPSGKGLRGFIQGRLPGRSFLNHEAGVEFYDGSSPRYLTVTGHKIAGDDIKSVSESALATVYSRYKTSTEFGGEAATEMPLLLREDELPTLPDGMSDSLVAFLKEGRVEGYPSRSEVLLAVALKLTLEDWNAEQTLSYLYFNPYSMGTALEHRTQDSEKALAYLWRTVCTARRYAERKHSPQPFNNLALSGIADAKTGWGEISDRADLARDAGSAVYFLDSEPKPREFLIPGLLPLAKFGVIAGPGGAAKSRLSIGIALQVGTGFDFLGVPRWSGSTPKRVLYLSAEDETDELHARARHWMDEWCDAQPDPSLSRQKLKAILADHTVHFVDVVRSVPKISNEESILSGADWIKRQIEQLDIGLLILDPLASFHLGQELQLQPFVETCRAIASETGCTVLVLHHTNKASREENGRAAYAARGDTRLIDGARFVITVAPMSASEASDNLPEDSDAHARNYIGLQLAKTNYTARTDVLWFRLVDGPGGMQYEPFTRAVMNPSLPGTTSRDGEANTLLLRLIDEHCRAGNYCTRGNALALFKDALNCSRDRFRALLSQLIDDNQIEIRHFPEGDERRIEFNKGYLWPTGLRVDQPSPSPATGEGERA